jgi:hypothetical protein
VAHLQAALAASERQREEVAGQLAAERAQASALRAQEGSIASRHRELQEAWKGMVDELRAQLKVGGWLLCVVVCQLSVWSGIWLAHLSVSECVVIKADWLNKSIVHILDAGSEGGRPGRQKEGGCLAPGQELRCCRQGNFLHAARDGVAINALRGTCTNIWHSDEHRAS